MGLYTYVVVDVEVMPAEYQGAIEWQTKDVVDCQMETLRIASDGTLHYVWYEREWAEREDVQSDTPEYLRSYLKPTVEHDDIIPFHGEMDFYSEFADLRARFTDGKLTWIRKI